MALRVAGFMKAASGLYPHEHGPLWLAQNYGCRGLKSDRILGNFLIDNMVLNLMCARHVEREMMNMMCGWIKCAPSFQKETFGISRAVLQWFGTVQVYKMWLCKWNSCYKLTLPNLGGSNYIPNQSPAPNQGYHFLIWSKVYPLHQKRRRKKLIKTPLSFVSK